ncbi:MAG: hypothetical protein HRF46_09215 [Acidobacteriota bacterium]
MLAFTCSLLLAATAAVPAAPTPADLARLTPPDAQVVMGIHVAALRSHPAVQAWLANHQAPWTGRGSEAEALLEELGLDPLRDVDASVLAAVDRPGEEDSWVLLLGGSFNPTAMSAALTRRGATLVPGMSYPLLRTSEETDDAPLMAFFDHLVVVGDERSVLAAASGATMGAGVVRVERAAGRLDPTATSWLVVDIPPALRQNPQVIDGAPEAMRGLLSASRAVERMIMHARLGEALELSGWARADAPENAELLHDAAKGMVAALRLSAQGHYPELLEVLRQVRITQSEREVTGTAAIPLALIEQLAEAAAQSARRPTER